MRERCFRVVKVRRQRFWLGRKLGEGKGVSRSRVEVKRSEEEEENIESKNGKVTRDGSRR